MKPAALVFLAGNSVAQKLAITWPIVPADERCGFGAWARLADVLEHRAQAIGQVLRAHEICLPDGTLDPLAEQYIASQVAGTMPKRPK